MLQVGIYIYNEVEILDFAGPFEVFSTASRVFRRLHPDSEPPFRAFTVAASPARIEARGGLLLQPDFTFSGHPPIDVLLIPGGVIAAGMENPAVISWIAAQAAKARLTASVCTGSFLLGKAGLLTGKRATTHWEDIADLRGLLPETEILAGTRWVDEGTIVTAAGISAGLDMSLHLVERLAGRELAVRTARQMDYRWHSEEDEA